MRGFGRWDRRRQLIEFIRDRKLDFVGIQETFRESFTDFELAALGGRMEFHWDWIPARGRSGGILLGINCEAFDLISVHRGRYFMGAALRQKNVDLAWELCIVYGLADHSFSADFLHELFLKVSASSLPVVVCGDLNMVRGAQDRSNGLINVNIVDMFNDWIAYLALREIHRSGARFTWTNNQLDPIRCVLDRVLVSHDWEAKFSLCSLSAEPRFGSDHCPLTMDSGEPQAEQPLLLREAMVGASRFCCSGLRYLAWGEGMPSAQIWSFM